MDLTRAHRLLLGPLLPAADCNSLVRLLDVGEAVQGVVGLAKTGWTMLATRCPRLLTYLRYAKSVEGQTFFTP